MTKPPVKASDKGVAAQPSLADIEPYQQGKSRLENFEQPVRLSSNESSYGCSPMATEAFLRAQQELHRYPDGSQLNLREAVAEIHNVSPAQIVCGNGSEELIGLCTRSYVSSGEEVILTRNHFVMCPIYARAQGADVILADEAGDVIDVDQILAAITDRTRMVIVANPNNPTGTYFNASELERLISGVPESILLILDGAYAEYVTAADYNDGLGYVSDHINIVVTHTFSKIYGLAALRVGWACADQSVLQEINKLRTPFNVNGPAMAAAVAAIRDQAFVEKVRDANRKELDWILPAVRGLGFAVTDSVANFYLVDIATVEGATSEGAASYLESCGVIPRPGGGDGRLRLTVGNREENEAAMNALEAYLEQLK